MSYLVESSQAALRRRETLSLQTLHESYDSIIIFIDSIVRSATYACVLSDAVLIVFFSLQLQHNALL